MKNNPFNKLRPFIASCVLFSFALLALSGLVLFFEVRFLGGQGMWRHGHQWFSFMFFFSFLAHLALDWKNQKQNFAGSTRAMQWLAAIFMCLVFLVGVFLSSVDKEEWRPDAQQGRIITDLRSNE